MQKDEMKLMAHVFICTNTRENGECCSTKGSIQLRDEVKALTKEWKGKVRINAAGCLGHCAEGITAVIYPEGRWLTHLKKESVETVIKTIEELRVKT